MEEQFWFHLVFSNNPIEKYCNMSAYLLTEAETVRISEYLAYKARYGEHTPTYSYRILYDPVYYIICGGDIYGSDPDLMKFGFHPKVVVWSEQKILITVRTATPITSNDCAKLVGGFVLGVSLGILLRWCLGSN